MYNKKFSLSVLVAAASLLAACGDLGQGKNRDTGPRSGYPEGPYGKNEGSILENLEFVATDDSAFSLQNIYADGVNQLLLLTTAAGWCTACREEQPALQDLYDTYAS